MPSNFVFASVCATGWFTSSVLISVYNKWTFGDGLNFAFPLFLTALHQVCLFLFSFLVILVWPSFRATHTQTKDGLFLLMIPIYIVVTQILPCAVASAGDIGLSNASLMFIPLSLYTMVKTSSLLFVLIFGLLFRLERFSWRLVLIVIIMCTSVVMMTMKPKSTAEKKSTTESAYSLGLMLITIASAFLGLRWCFSQLLLKKSKYATNPFLTIFYLASPMAVLLFGLAVTFEGWSNFTSLPVWEENGFLKTLILILIPAVLAFAMMVCELQLLSMVQILTLSITGIVKELFIVALSSLIFGDTLSLVNGLGLLMTTANMMWYNYHRYNENGRELGDKNYSPIAQDDEEFNITGNIELESTI